MKPGPVKNENPPEHTDSNGKCECERCKNPEAYDAKIKEIMEKGPGWFAHYVLDDDSTPNRVNIHTHGLVEKYKHPDLQLCIALPQKVAHGILWTAVGAIEKGSKFGPGKRYDEILNGYDVMFAWAEENGRPVLRMILPDKDNKFNTLPYSKQWTGTDSKPVE